MKTEEIVDAARNAGFSSSEIMHRLAAFKQLINSAACAEREKFTNTQEFVTLPREAVERALAALDAEDPYRADIVLRAALEQTQESPYGECDECGTEYSFDPTDGGSICVACLKERLEQPQNHVPDVGNMTPEGWKLVPVEPTEKMIDMGRGLSSFPDGVYRAMLAAAPKPPALKQPQVKASAIPAGWKLVPSDATHQWAENLADRGMRISSLASAISDMLAAAPQPPTTEESSVVQPQVEQEPVALLADAIRAEPTELIHKWRVLELIQDHARQQTKREPLTDEETRRIYNAATYHASLAVFMTRMDAEDPDADDKGVSGWLQEAEDRVKHRTIERAHEIGGEA